MGGTVGRISRSHDAGRWGQRTLQQTNPQPNDCIRKVFGFDQSRTLDSCARTFYFKAMATTATPEIRPGIDRNEETDSRTKLEPGYLVICWNDPVNLMDYVTHVFQVVFGWQRQKAEKHMLQVHNQGKSVLVRESMERAEFYVHQLQKYSLHATMERDQV